MGAIMKVELTIDRMKELPKGAVPALEKEQDGYDAMVKTLAQAWSQEAAAIASELNRLP